MRGAGRDTGTMGGYFRQAAKKLSTTLGGEKASGTNVTVGFLTAQVDLGFEEASDDSFFSDRAGNAGVAM